jgi:MoxR-like ATPase
MSRIRFTDDQIAAALAAAGGDVMQAAQQTGASMSTIYAAQRRLRAAGVNPTFGQGLPVPPMQQPPVQPVQTAQPPVKPIVQPSATPIAVQQTPEPTEIDLEQAASAPVQEQQPVLPMQAQTEMADPTEDLLCNDLPDLPAKDPRWISRHYFKRMQARLAQGCNALLIGPAGTGKTCAAKQHAAEQGLPFWRISLENSSSLRDLFGRLSLVNAGSGPRTIFVESMFAALCRRQQGAVLLIDECNMADPQRSAPLHELLDDRTFLIREARGGIGRLLRIPQAVQFVLACNPPGAAFSGAQRMNAALVDRCAVLPVPPLTARDLDRIMKGWGVNDQEQRRTLARIWTDCDRAARDQNLKIQVSIRALRRTIDGLSEGLSIRDAVAEGFTNASEALGDKAARAVIDGILTTILPPPDQQAEAQAQQTPEGETE